MIYTRIIQGVIDSNELFLYPTNCRFGVSNALDLQHLPVTREWHRMGTCGDSRRPSAFNRGFGACPRSIGNVGIAMVMMLGIPPITITNGSWVNP